MKKFRKSLAGVLSSFLLSFPQMASGELDAFGRVIPEDNTPEIVARYPDSKWTDPTRVKTTCDLTSSDGKSVLRDSLEVILEQESSGVRVILAPMIGNQARSVATNSENNFEVIFEQKPSGTGVLVVPIVGSQNKSVILNCENTSIDFLHPDLRVGNINVEEYNFGVADASTLRGYEKRKVGTSSVPSMRSAEALKQRLFSGISAGIDCGQNEPYSVCSVKSEALPFVKVDDAILIRNVAYSEYLIKRALDGKDPEAMAELPRLRERALGARQELNDAIRMQNDITNGNKNYHFVFGVDSSSAIREPVIGVVANASILFGGCEYRSPEIFLRMQLNKDMLVEEYCNTGEVFIAHPSSEKLKFMGRKFANYGAKKYPYVGKHAPASSLGNNWTYYYNAGYTGGKDGPKEFLSIDEGTCHSPEIERVIMKKDRFLFREFFDSKRAIYVQEGVVIDSDWAAIRAREGVLEIPSKYVNEVGDGVVRFKENSPLIIGLKSSVNARRSVDMRVNDGAPEFCLVSDVKFEPFSMLPTEENLDEEFAPPIKALALSSRMSGYKVHPADFYFLIDEDYYNAMKKDGFSVRNSTRPMMRVGGYTYMSGYTNSVLSSFRRTNVPGVLGIKFHDNGSFYPVDLIGSKDPNGVIVDGKREVIKYYVWNQGLMPKQFMEDLFQ